jgi:hypothetical protein
MLPNFIGIGAPKAGTTWLFQCLQDHPQVFVAPAKELNFFHYGTIEGRLAEYEEHFAAAGTARAVGEVSVRYLASERAPQRIKALIPTARLWVSLRNPVDQVYSHYWHLRRQNFHEWDVVKPPESVEEAVERYPERLLEPAAYARHIERWLQHFDRSQLLALLYDDIRADPRRVLRALYAYLDVDPDFVPSSVTDAGSNVRQGRSPRGPVFEWAHSQVYRLLNVHVYYRLKLLLGSRRAVRVKDVLRLRQVMETVFFRKGYPPMSAPTRRFLAARFTTEIDQLQSLLRHDLAGWR